VDELVQDQPSFAMHTSSDSFDISPMPQSEGGQPENCEQPTDPYVTSLTIPIFGKSKKLK
jgi:hypothetical protein